MDVASELHRIFCRMGRERRDKSKQAKKHCSLNHSCTSNQIRAGHREVPRVFAEMISPGSEKNAVGVILQTCDSRAEC